MAAHEKEQVLFMRGGGHYNKNSALQHLAIEGLFPHFPNLNAGTVNEAHFPVCKFKPNRTLVTNLTVVDYGSSAGLNS